MQTAERFAAPPVATERPAPVGGRRPQVPTGKLPADVDPAGPEMSRIFTVGSLIGIPLLFAFTLLVSGLAGASLGGGAALSAWAALVGGPFFGAMIFLGKRVGELGHED